MMKQVSIIIKALVYMCDSVTTRGERKWHCDISSTLDFCCCQHDISIIAVKIGAATFFLLSSLPVISVHTITRLLDLSLTNPVRVFSTVLLKIVRQYRGLECFHSSIPTVTPASLSCQNSQKRTEILLKCFFNSFFANTKFMIFLLYKNSCLTRIALFAFSQFTVTTTNIII